MRDTAGRLLRLLGLLQRRPAWRGGELAERLGVEGRTVRRDVERLRQLGYQVEGTPGAAGGYRLVGGTDVPPLLFDDEEAMAVAVVLGVSAGAAVPGIEQGVLAALGKLDRLLPRRLHAPLAALRAATVSLATPGEPVPPEQLVRLAQACEQYQLVTFPYRAQDGQQSERRVEPHRLVATDRRWYLLAYDLDRDDWRTFRVDRAGEIALPGHTFRPRPLRDPGRIVAEAITTGHYAHRAVVLLLASRPEVAKLVPPDVGMLTAAGAHTRLELGVDDFDWLAGFLVGLGLDFEAIDPPELREHLAALGDRLADAHRPVPGGSRKGGQVP